MVRFIRALGAAAALLVCAAIAAPPPAPSEPVTDTLHGVRVADPYRNLENLKSPQTQAWLKAQGEYGAGILERIDGRDALARRVAELAKASGDQVRQVTRLPGQRFYYLQRKAGDAQFKLVMRVGLQGAERAEESANGITNTSEFGTVKDPAEFAALLEMSTYHQVRDGTAYPAVMLIHGLNDPRVDVWHSAKAAARLQAASSSGKPVFMRLDGQAGHGVGSTAQQAVSQLADIYAFLLWQFGRLAATP